MPTFEKNTSPAMKRSAYKMKYSNSAFPFKSPLRIVPTDPNPKKKKNKVIPTPSDTTKTLSHSDTTTAGNPVTPQMIDHLRGQGFTKKEVNVLHKHNEPGQPYGRTGKIKKK